MRGKESQFKFSTSFTGITPACAGKSISFLGCILALRDHPRVCGEKSHQRQGLHPVAGSPPRVRGKGAKPRQRRTESGITPACAGKSSTGSSAAHPAGDHPRVCGEKLSGSDSTKILLGSPPRVRGKVLFTSLSRFVQGITPACAGKSRPCKGLCRDGQDHPRVCGEKTKKIP